MGAQIVKEVSIKTNDVAGDGTTTAMVLAQNMIREGVKNVAAGGDPMAIKRGMDKAVVSAVDALKERIQWVTFGDTNVKPTKANIKRHRNNVKCLCDFLQINEPVMTSYMIDAFKNCFYICKTDYKILLAELKPSDTETMEYLDKKIKSMETK